MNGNASKSADDLLFSLNSLLPLQGVLFPGGVIYKENYDMNAAATMQVYNGYGEDCPFRDKLYKIYSDGSHYIARAAMRAKAPKRTKREKTEIDDIFAFLYADGLKCDMTDKELREFILTNLEDLFPVFPDLEKYVNENVDRMMRNTWQREKRFRRKAYLNKWNYFVTFTYNGKKHTEETFRKKLRKCLSNLHTRRGWNFMGVWERGEETDNGRQDNAEKGIQ